MKICVTSTGNTLESDVDMRFGRCKYFIIVDTESLEFEAVENPNMEAMGGAGIQSGQLISSKAVKGVLTGNVGPNAFNVLRQSGVDVYTGAGGTVKQAVEEFKKGAYKKTPKPNVGNKFGS
jgi:predicted Fe-Mo cluster-binding NifX family protein